MSYIRSNGRKALGDASSCSASQDWDPDCTLPGMSPGQCVPRGTAGKAAGCSYPTKSSSSGGGFWDFLGKASGGVLDVLKAKSTPAPVTNIITPGGGMSTTTKVAIAGAGALALVLVLRNRK